MYLTVFLKNSPIPKTVSALNRGTVMEGVNAPPQPQRKANLASISSTLHLPAHVRVPTLGITARHGAHRGAVGGPGDEEPLVALGVLAVQAVQHVARLLLIQQGQHEGIVVSVPAPGQLFVGSQHELFWKKKREKVVLDEGKA